MGPCRCEDECRGLSSSAWNSATCRAIGHGLRNRSRCSVPGSKPTARPDPRCFRIGSNLNKQSIYQARRHRAIAFEPSWHWLDDTPLVHPRSAPRCADVRQTGWTAPTSGAGEGCAARSQPARSCGAPFGQDAQHGAHDAAIAGQRHRLPADSSRTRAFVRLGLIAAMSPLTIKHARRAIAALKLFRREASRMAITGSSSKPSMRADPGAVATAGMGDAGPRRRAVDLDRCRRRTPHAHSRYECRSEQMATQHVGQMLARLRLNLHRFAVHHQRDRDAAHATITAATASEIAMRFMPSSPRQRRGARRSAQWRRAMAPGL